MSSCLFPSPWHSSLTCKWCVRLLPARLRVALLKWPNPADVAFHLQADSSNVDELGWKCMKELTCSPSRRFHLAYPINTSIDDAHSPPLHELPPMFLTQTEKQMYSQRERPIWHPRLLLKELVQALSALIKVISSQSHSARASFWRHPFDNLLSHEQICFLFSLIAVWYSLCISFHVSVTFPSVVTSSS